jgi:hypothetical protein
MNWLKSYRSLISDLLLHITVSIAAILVLKLNSPQSLILLLAGSLIDIDHLFYLVFYKHLLNFENMVDWSREEQKMHNPHFYVFHNIEVIALILLIGKAYSANIFILGIGFFLHYLGDVATYIYYYKSFKTWPKYVSLTINLISSLK